jgi:hypothetical protein
VYDIYNVSMCLAKMAFTLRAGKRYRIYNEWALGKVRSVCSL